jgi:hypothetical protein
LGKGGEREPDVPQNGFAVSKLPLSLGGGGEVNARLPSQS